MKKIIHLAFLLCLILPRLSAQCVPSFFCSTDTINRCDLSPNDPVFWNANGFWDPVLLQKDLAEGLIELRSVWADTCGVAGLTVGFSLWMNLDGFVYDETVLTQNNLLSGGRIIVGNIGGIGDTLQFDTRPVPDSLRNRFVLEVKDLGDSITAELVWRTGQVNANSTTPLLPHGTYSMVWWADRNGQRDSCWQYFSVRDCVPPTIKCVDNLFVDLPPINQITLWAIDFIDSISDNITPMSQLRFAMRKSGYGNGFPLTPEGNPQTSVTYTCCELGTQNVQIWVMDAAGNTAYCETYVIIQSNLGNCSCSSSFGSCACFPGGGCLEDEIGFSGQFLLNGGTSFTETQLDECFFFVLQPAPILAVIKPFTVQPNHLNGVSTYDLVLISRHIQNLEPLNTPYKMIAADANKSGSITTFDIVELRRLILGVYDALPNNKAYRFVPQNYTFPNPYNPFNSVFPESAIITSPIVGYNQNDFYAIKIGDVNNTAVPNASIITSDRQSALITMQDISLEAGHIYNIPLQIKEKNDLAALQAAFGYDPQRIEIASVTTESLPHFDAENWALPTLGELRVSWSETQPAELNIGQTILMLRLRALQNGPLSAAWRGLLPHTVLASEIHNPAGQARNLALAFGDATAPSQPFVWQPQPNPTHSGTTLAVLLPESTTLHCQLFDPNGRLVFEQEPTLPAGTQYLDLPSAAFPVAGLYAWRVQAGGQIWSGKIVRQ